MTDSVAVIIAAKDAETTIGTAVASALAADEVTEVMVVDDASTDQTAAAANDAAGGDPRLRILRQEVNSGPASARNRAIDESTAPVLAILDADDAVLPGRFGHLLSFPGWDLAADNIVFLPEDGFDTRSSDWPTDEGARELSLAAFVAGNISRPGAQRGELGFLKPLIRRAFLDRHRLRYDAALRLGEDYDLYVRALMAGARFRLSHRVGYCARIREASLSGRHDTADLAALSEATKVHLSSVAAGDPAFALLRRQNRDIRRRYLLRACLDAKATGGLPAALRFALVSPARFLPILRGVAADKIAAARGAQPATVDARVLLSPGG
ncbi:glycosyltransferase [Rhodobacterales bacterium HKCCE3408]|nr:glycosyltransferase [Rhodobacterales bacterium HKCCE3408]